MSIKKIVFLVVVGLAFCTDLQAKYLDSTAYNELVFPKDLNEFPIIIQDGGIKKGQIKGKYLESCYKHINKFVSNQKEKAIRDVQFLTVKDIENLPIETHPYLIKMHFFELLPKNGAIYSQTHIGFRILDRRNDHFYRFSGKLKSMIVMMDRGYREKDVYPHTAKKYFKELSRILDNQDAMNNREFQLEERKVQKRRDRRGVNIVLGLAGGMILGGAIVGIVSTF